MSDLSKYSADIPATLAKLHIYREMAQRRYMMHLQQNKALATIEGAEEQAQQAQRDAGEWEIKAWLSEARIGELLGKGGDAMLAGTPSNVLEGSDHHSRYFARRFHDELISGGLGKMIEKVEKDGPVAFRLPISKAHVSKNFGDNEWYTPKEYIDAAVEVMGGIDLDPASTKEANEIVNAAKYFTIEDDALNEDWNGRVWMNPPYSTGLIEKFCEKLSNEYGFKHTTEAIALVNNASDTRWYHENLCLFASAKCEPVGRVRFWNPHGDLSVPLQGQFLVYFGKEPRRFCDIFSRFGYTWVKHAV